MSPSEVFLSFPTFPASEYHGYLQAIPNHIFLCVFFYHGKTITVFVFFSKCLFAFILFLCVLPSLFSLPFSFIRRFHAFGGFPPHLPLLALIRRTIPQWVSSEDRFLSLFSFPHFFSFFSQAVLRVLPLIVARCSCCRPCHSSFAFVVNFKAFTDVQETFFFLGRPRLASFLSCSTTLLHPIFFPFSPNCLQFFITTALVWFIVPPSLLPRSASLFPFPSSSF